MPALAPPLDPVVSPRTSTELARWVLADRSVRSFSIDPANDEATVRYHGSTVQRASLEWVAKRFGEDAVRLELTPVVPLPAAEVEGWRAPVGSCEDFVRSPEVASGWRRAMHLTLAGVWFTLAVLGAILPGLPCTCFLLLTSYSLCRSSKRLHQRLLDSEWFGPTLRHWRVHHGVRPGIKTKALTTMALMIGASLWLAPLPLIAWWAVAAAGAIGAAVVGRLRVVQC